MADTCVLAIQRIQHQAQQKPKDEGSQSKHSEEKAAQDDGAHRGMSEYDSIDPALLSPELQALSTAELKAQLINKSLSLYQRYQAMFALRNQATEEAVRLVFHFHPFFVLLYISFYVSILFALFLLFHALSQRCLLLGYVRNFIRSKLSQQDYRILLLSSNMRLPMSWGNYR